MGKSSVLEILKKTLSIFYYFYFQLNFIYLFLESRREGERGRETLKCGSLSRAPTGDLACNPSMCPDWE